MTPRANHPTPPTQPVVFLLAQSLLSFQNSPRSRAKPHVLSQMMPLQHHSPAPSHNAFEFARAHAQDFVALALLIACLLPAPLAAQPAAPFPQIQSMAEREIQRREAVAATYVPDMMQRGKDAFDAKDYESAFTFYRAAVDALPPGGLATAKLREQALDGFCRAAISLARQRISEGRFQDAEAIVAVVLQDNYNPKYKPALTLEAQLKDPSYFNRTLSPQFIAKVEEVKQLLQEADGFYQSGRYDLAFRRYEQVLQLDRYNIAARRGMERVNRARQTYAESAYNQTRTAMITQVEKAWEMPVPRRDAGMATIIEQPAIDVTGTQMIQQKLESIIIPRVEFRDATIREAVDFIRQQAARLDTAEPDPNRRGVNIVLLLDEAAREAAAQSRITLNLSNVPLGEVLRFVAEAAGLKLKLDPFAVAVVPLDTPTDVLLTKEYKVPPAFITQSMEGAGAGREALTTRAGARQLLEARGVTFPDGAFAQFLPASSTLIVRNTPANLALIDQLVEIALATPPTQVQISAKFLEVTQNNLQELGLEWLVGNFALPFGSGVYGGGGDAGSKTLNTADLPFVNPDGSPVGGTQSNGIVARGPLTGGLRSGSAAITANGLDALLFATPAGPAPGVLALAGVFTNPQFQVILRALSQAKGIDLMSAPSVVTKPGQQANIEVVTDFIYPTAYSDPQVPTNQDPNVINPVTPATPENFQAQPIGVILSVTPTVAPDNYTIELDVRPQVIEFEGFINYGSPILTNAPIFGPPVAIPVIGGTGTITFAQPVIGNRQILLTENIINQPVFSFREIQTTVKIHDGMTIALGGLLREDVQNVNDKVPLLGDLPLAGRLFRTSASQHIKKNLVIFVTANLIDPSGVPVAAGLGEEIPLDELQPPPLPEQDVISTDATLLENQL